MSESVVLDSSALLAYLQEEDGADEVGKALLGASTAGTRHLVTSVNWAEILYAAARQVRFEDVAEVAAAVDQLPVQMVEVGRDLSVIAAGFKCEHALGLADAYAAALAILLDVPLMTTDDDFDALEAGGLQLRRIR